MRILYATTIGLTMIFFRKFVKSLIDDGNVVDIITNEDDFPVDGYFKKLGCKVYNVPWSRNPLSKSNIVAAKMLKSIAADYDLVHCHTPVASACTRLACKKLRKNGLKVYYTAHGFHFYKGAPIANWCLYYPAEWLLSFLSDTLITINTEDYHRAQKRLHAKRTAFVPGMGVEIDKFSNTKIDVADKRRRLGIPEDCFLVLSVGEYNKNKNHETVIRALAEVKYRDIHYAIAGEGELADHLTDLAGNLQLSDRVHLLGFHTDVAEIYKAADINVFPSIREGFGLAAVEGMAAGLPLICSDNRGTKSYARDDFNALVCKNNSVSEYAKNIERLYSDKSLRQRLTANGNETVKMFSVDMIGQKMKALMAEDFDEISIDT